jgi:hypothetical protein
MGNSPIILGDVNSVLRLGPAQMHRVGSHAIRVSSRTSCG